MTSTDNTKLKRLRARTFSTNHDWLHKAELVSIICSCGSSVAIFFIQELLLLSVPVSLSLALNFINRRKLRTQIDELGSFITQADKQPSQDSSEQLNALLQSQSSKIEDMQLKFDAESDRTQYLIELQISNQKLVLDNADPEAHFSKGMSLFKLGYTHESIPSFSKAIHSKPDFANAYFLRGCAYLELNNHYEATRDLQRAAGLFFKSKDLNAYQKAIDRLKMDVDNRERHSENSSDIKLENFLVID